MADKVWHNYPNETTPITADDLNRIERGLVHYHGEVASNTDLNDLTERGVYMVTLYSVSQTLKNAPPSPSAGTIIVDRLPGGAVKQTYNWGLGFGTPREMYRVVTASSQSDWISSNPTQTSLDSGTDILSIVEPGTYSAGTPAIARSLVGLPEEVDAQPGYMEVQSARSSANNYRLVRKWNTYPYATGRNSRTFVRTETQNGVHHDWEEVGGDLEEVRGVDVRRKQEMLKQQSLRRHGGRIGVGDKVPVGLSFDHGFVNYIDKLLPHLDRLSLPHSVAINHGTLEIPGESEGVTLSDIQDIVIRYGVEPSNHGYSHRDQTDVESMRSDILGSLELLQSEMDLVEVDSFIMPGVSGTGWDGFNSGFDYEKWYTHPAGRMILDNHAVVTSGLLGMATPMTGNPIQSVDRMGVDYSSWTTVAQQRIQSLYGSGMGIQVFNHPNLVDSSGYITLTRLVAFFEWLAQERDAGKIEVLTVSGFAWATTDNDRRHDLMHGEWGARGAELEIAPMKEWCLGGQWMFESESASSSVLTVTIQGGDNLYLEKEVSPSGDGKYRVLFTIPKDAENLTIQTSADLVDPGVYSV